ncbi:hypothetical protein DPSP01_001236 [Paraphaeosphaeria sporulosa]|uniref:DUF7730 domain-containing protein n=1 Tax=Paraphaeosphaeria sporulosa TaxID=1460663 RepID=A0A177C142_9PLEO|nr:uncharacterized protein CC84DRAFT_1155243 [Paraphaeosphaeria sporulosa]OAG00437.1 hypothetical protein CC84DRAFT_1155243 [Paraphaeosphaeria sporulosa]
MNKKCGTLAHTRPRVTLKKRVGFLELPGEIRNQIYEYHFQRGFKCEFVEMGAKLGHTQRECLKFLSRNRRSSDIYAHYLRRPAPVADVRFSRVLGRYERIQGLDTRWNTSLTGLIFICKQVYTECIGFFYLNTTFVFDSPSRIANFLKVPSATNLANVAKIQLHYRVYGEPWETKDVRWKEKHLHSWNRTCKTVAKKLTNLQHIDIWIYTRERSLRFGMDEPYLKPFCWFCKRLDPSRTLAKSLITSNVHLITAYNRWDSFTDRSLQLASLHLHKLFEEAIGCVILGANPEVAMKDFNGAWENQYTQWHHHLQFARTGW